MKNLVKKHITVVLIALFSTMAVYFLWNARTNAQYEEKPEPIDLAASDIRGVESREGTKGTPTGAGVCDLGGASAIEVQASAGTLGPTGYPTLKDAFDAINAGTHTVTITIDVCGNTTETASAVLNASGTGSASYTSILVRPVGSARTIEGTITGAVVKLNGADNVTLDGRIGGVGTLRSLTVRNNSTATATAAIWLASVAAGNGASNNIVRNLEVAAGQTATTGTNTTIGIYMGGTTVSLTSTDGNDNDNNQFMFNRITRARYGFASRGVTSNNNEGLVVTDNTIGPSSFGADEIGKAGIFLQADTGALISRNTVQFVGGDLANTTAGADRCGICVGGENWSVSDSTTITSGDYTVTKNVIHDIVEERTFSSIGIKLGTTRSGSATNNLVANNFIYNVRSNGTLGDQTVGIGYANGHTDRIVFNSIAMTGDFDPGAAASAATYANAIRVSQANGSNNANLTLMNNSIYLDVISNTATVHFYAITLNSSAYAFGTGGLNFNNYFINQANAQLRTGGLVTTGTGGAATTEFQTLANWQAALTAPQDANSIQADPLYFSNTGDLHIPGNSPNVNVGTAVTGVSDDIDSQARPNGVNPEIGADEFYPSPGTLQFSSPTYTQTEAGGTAVITVTRAGGSTGAVSVNFATSDGSAVGGGGCAPGIDYVSTSGTLNWGDLDLANKTFNVTLCNDGVAKGSETVNLTLSSPGGGATVGTPGAAVLTILNSTTFGSSATVGVSETITSLTNPGGLFDQINTGALSTNLVVDITSDLTAETGAIALNQFAGGFTLTIQPSGSSRTISGSHATALIDFNGADGVTIDGSISEGDANSLLIRNTGVGAVVRYINDASNNSLIRTNLESGSNSSVISISTGISTGNDNITIAGNVIRDRTDAAGVPFNSINLIGTSAAISNSGILIDDNQIINFLQAGIVVGTSDNVTFTGNDISQTAQRTTSIFGVAVNSAAGTNLFENNSVHDMTTTLSATGMQFNDSRDTTVSGNRIFNFPSTSGSTGTLNGLLFNGSSGNPATVTFANNMISILPSFTNAQSIFGIRDFSFGGNTFNAFYNTAVISGTGSGTTNTWACQRGFAAPTTFTMTNNICFNGRTGGGNHFAGGDQSSNTGTFASNFNVFVGTGTTAANFFDKATSSTAVPVDFATWQAGPPARDANSQASNPSGNFTIANMFVSTTDLHLANLGSNPASNTGTPIAVTVDFDNETRNASTPDIGADEVNVVATPVSVSGRLTSTAGRGIAGAYVYLEEEGGATRVAISNTFGYFQFFEVLTQQDITVTAVSKRYSCPSTPLFLSGAATVNSTCTGTP